MSIKSRFIALKDQEEERGAPYNYSLRIARKTLLKELTDAGISNQDAVLALSKAEREIRDEVFRGCIPHY